ncbi:hypothetical protein J3T92_07180 [Bifidobacterium sp. B4081]|nr:hypothetical protein [Bifidobacterium sp. B4077]MCX8646385.1 hypothetical protein [Bifidobacterium sp. B4081]MCX8668192.1 hypothetical protein [Bifidobacterium sp. B3998]
MQEDGPGPAQDGLPPAIEPEGGPGPAKGPRPRWLVPVIAAVVVAVVAVAGLIAWRVSSNRSHERALASCSRQVRTLQASERRVTGPSSDYRRAVAVKADQVKDAKTVDALRKTVRGMEGVKPQIIRCEASMSKSGLQAATDKVKKLDERYQSLDKSARAVIASRDAKSLDDAKTALNGKKDEAARLLGDSDGKVADNAVRDSLQQAISQAGGVKSDKAKAYQDAASALQSAMDQVNASIQQKSQADQAAQQQAQAAAQSAPASAAQQRSAPSNSPGRQGYTPSRQPSYNHGGGGGSAPAPAAPAPAPAAPQGGGGQSFEEWSHSNTTGGHGCNPDGSCGIG